MNLCVTVQRSVTTEPWAKAQAAGGQSVPESVSVSVFLVHYAGRLVLGVSWARRLLRS